MKEKFLNTSINFIGKYYSYDKKGIEKLKYGLEGLYLTLTKIVFTFILALLLGIIKEFFIVLLLFNFLRYFGFGFHAENSSQCLILSSFWFVILPFILLKLNITLNIFIILCFLCIVCIMLFAPSDTIKRPLYNKKKRIIRKILNTILAIIYVSVALILKSNYFYTLILTSLIIEVIVINPLTYKIFKQPYNNYKNKSRA